MNSSPIRRLVAQSLAIACCIAGSPVALAQASPAVQTVAIGLENPWGVAFLPSGRFLVAERPGRLRMVEADGTVGAPVAGLPAIAAGGPANSTP